MTKVRPAMLDDLDGIMELEEETFGAVSMEAMASRETMESRINMLNGDQGQWFWVAEDDGLIVADMIMQPTDIEPDECSSWHKATDGGKLIKTFNPAGKNLYGVSLGISKSAQEGTMELLMHVQFYVWLKGGQKYFMICSRIPDYRKHSITLQVTPDEYWQMKTADGQVYDALLRYFSEFVGVKPVRLLPNGFPEDPDSMGYGVLCVGDDPRQAIHENILQLSKAGIKLEWILK